MISSSLIWIALGGAFGAITRYAVSLIVGYPYGTLTVNIVGSFLMGLLFMCGPLYLVVSGLGIFCMYFYALDRKRHAQLLTELKERRVAVSNQRADYSK